MIIAIIAILMATTVTTMMVVANRWKYQRIEKCGVVELFRELGLFWVRTPLGELPFKTKKEAIEHYASMIRVFYLPELYNTKEV